MINTIIDYCVAQILEKKKRPLLVAVTGDSGSGKSYYADLIKNKLTQRNASYTFIDNDDFLIPRKDREPMKLQFYDDGPFKGKSRWEILENMFYLEKFTKVIDDLRSGRSSTYYPYSRDTGDVSKTDKTVAPQDLVIFASSMLLEQMDFIILVDVSQENIIKRKLLRDRDIRTPEQIVDMHKKVQGYYWERCRPSHADIVIDNNDIRNPFLVA